MIKTLDDLIKELESFRIKYGGNVRVCGFDEYERSGSSTPELHVIEMDENDKIFIQIS